MFSEIDPKIQQLVVPITTDTRINLISSTFFQSDLDGSIGQQRKACLSGLWESANGCWDPDQLFEIGYSYGINAEKINLDPILREALQNACGSIFAQRLAGIVETTPEGKKYLPQLPITSLAKDDPRLIEDPYSVLVLGIASGVSLQQPNTEQLIETEENSRFVDLKIPSQRKEILTEIIQDPSAITDMLDEPESMEDLINCEKLINDLFPVYYKTRIEPIIRAKKASQIKGTRNYDAWSILSVDKYAGRANSFLIAEKDKEPYPKDTSEFSDLGVGNPFEQISKKEIFQVADRLARISLVREILYRDLQYGFEPRQKFEFDRKAGERSVVGVTSNNIPREIFAIVDGFLYSRLSQSNAVDRVSITDEFRNFLASQKDRRIIEQIETFMSETPYWKDSGRRQIVTPDTYTITPEQFREVKRIDTEYRKYMIALNEVYCRALDNLEDPNSAKIIEKLEGGLPLEIIPFIREISLSTRGRNIDSLRFDLIPNNGRYYVGEAQIISGGTPPAILYREAYEGAKQGETQFVEFGILKPFIDRLYSRADKPVLAILYSERPYSSDISKTTSYAGNRAFEDILTKNGIQVRTVFAKDLEQRSDGKWYFRDSDQSAEPISTIYNRADIVSEKASRSLQDGNFAEIIRAMASGSIDSFPPPIPILFGKGIYAAISDPDFEETLINSIGVESLNYLREVTPQTRWVSSDTDITKEPQKWIRKGAYQHATQGLIMGIDNSEDLLQQIENDRVNPYSAVIQEYVDSDQPVFRVTQRFKIGNGKQMSLLVNRPYRLRVEPTSINGEVVEIFVTGNRDRIVHGRETSIMTVANISI